MPRPRKWRKVCGLPENNVFGPLAADSDSAEVIIMTVDEYETVRLIDLERLKQEECALQMNIARTTVQGIYDEARKKIAMALVNGKILKICGGDYTVCDGTGMGCGGRGCNRHRCGHFNN